MNATETNRWAEATERDRRDNPTLYVVVPCYNESQVLPVTLPLFTEKLEQLIRSQRVTTLSRIVLVDDGSEDETHHIILAASKSHQLVECISLSRNHGHQNALLAGLMESRGRCDVAISMDADGQDDIQAIDRMIEAYLNGSDVVYGIRSSRKTDTRFKRTSARAFYGLMGFMGARTIPDHADYRLLSDRALDALAEFGETNLYLRGLVPLLGFPSSTVTYTRTERIAGKTHYPLTKMADLAVDGITSFSVRPLRIIFACGVALFGASLIGIVWSAATLLAGNAVGGWASIVSIVCMLGGIQILSLGIIGEYVGRIYLESKRRPRYIVKQTTLGRHPEYRQNA